MSDISLDITPDGSQSVAWDNWWWEVSVDIWGADTPTTTDTATQTQDDAIETPVAEEWKVEVVPAADVEPNGSEATENNTPSVKLDVAWLRSIAPKIEESKKTEAQKADNDAPTKPVYNDFTKNRIKQIHNWITWDNGSTNAKSAPKEKNEYITKDWLAISPEKYEKSLTDNVVLATFIKEMQPQIEEMEHIKNLNAKLQEKLDLQPSLGEDMEWFVSVMRKSREWDYDSSLQLIEMFWDEFDRILPGMWGKFNQFLNWYISSQSSKSTTTQASKILTKEKKLSKALEWMFS